MNEVVQKEQTVRDLVAKLERERVELMKKADEINQRISKIEAALSVIEVEVG